MFSTFMKMSLHRSPRILLAALAVPAATLFLTSYLYNHPLPASKSQSIVLGDTLPRSCSSSATYKIVNPRCHQGLTDTRAIFLSAQEIGQLSDEEILARFTKGYFGGWIFTPELTFFKVFQLFRKQLFPVDFSGEWCEMRQTCKLTCGRWLIGVCM